VCVFVWNNFSCCNNWLLLGAAAGKNLKTLPKMCKLFEDAKNEEAKNIIRHFFNEIHFFSTVVVSL
jgi:hypothetical protein